MCVFWSSDEPRGTAELWDQGLARDPKGHLLQTWAWGELKAGFGWTPSRIALVNEREQPVAGAQVLYRGIGPVSMAYLPKGPWFAPCADGLRDDLWAAVHEDARQRGAIALKVEPEWEDGDREAHAWLRGQGFEPGAPVQPRRTIIVDLRSDEDDILARMKSKWRYNVRLSIRRGVEVRALGATDDWRSGIDAFYRLMSVTGQRDAFGIHTQDYYARAMELFAPSDRARLFLALLDGEPLAGLCAFCCGTRAYYLYGASSNAHRELMPNHQLQWRAMQWAKGRGCTEYDLWGITDIDPESPSADLGGVERFKAGFGGEVLRTVGAYDRPYRPLLYRAFRMLRGQVAG